MCLHVNVEISINTAHVPYGQCLYTIIDRVFWVIVLAMCSVGPEGILT